MTRLPRLRREELDDAQRALFDRIAGSEKPGQRPRYPRVGADGGLEGPFNAMLYSADLGQALQDLGAQVRYASTLSDRCREIAILTAAAAWDSVYERYAHEDIARGVGLSEGEIAALRTGGDLRLTDPTEETVLAAARCLAYRRDLTDEEYASAVGSLGERRLFELVVLVGYYASVALSLRAFRVEPPSDRPSDPRSGG